MPYLTITISVTSDVAAQPNLVFQKVRRLFLTEVQLINLLKSGADGVGVYSAVPGLSQAPVQNVCILSNDSANPINFKLSSVTPADGVIALKSGGLLIAVDSSLAAGATANATVNNVNADAAAISGLAGGT